MKHIYFTLGLLFVIAAFFFTFGFLARFVLASESFRAQIYVDGHEEPATCIRISDGVLHCESILHVCTLVDARIFCRTKELTP